jgi:GSPII_E N-terminal domain.
MSISQDRRAWLPLGQMLVNEKLLTADQLNQALDRQRKTRERLGQILIDMKLIDEDILLKYLGAQFHKEPIARQDLAALDPDVVKLVPEEVARQYGVIAAQRSGRKLIVATADPLNVMAMDDLRRATGLDVDFRIGPASAIQEPSRRPTAAPPRDRPRARGSTTRSRWTSASPSAPPRPRRRAPSTFASFRARLMIRRWCAWSTTCSAAPPSTAPRIFT